MRSAARFLITAMAVSGVAYPQVAAQAQDDAGAKGTLTVNFTFKGKVIVPGKFDDWMAFNQAATIVCAVVAGSIAPTSHIQGPTPEQMAARDRYRKGGPGNTDPKARAAAERALAAAAGKFQSWFNESCSGTMTVDNIGRQDDPATPGPEPVVKTTGTRGIQTREPLVTIETDFDRNETRYRFISPQASGFEREAGNGMPARLETIMAIPVVSVTAGPYRGTIQSGRFEEPVSGGSYVIEWKFARRQPN